MALLLTAMNYINVKVLGSKLKYGSYLSELVGNCAKQRNWLSGVCGVSYRSNSFEREKNMKAGVILKRNYNTVAQRRNIGSNYVHSGDNQFFLFRRIGLLIFVRGMAGHSKWQNIRHIKAAKDRQKSLIIQKYSLAIKRAVIDGGPNPKANSKLAQLLEEARKHNVPNATIERSIEKAKATTLRSTVMEVQGPGGCLLVIEAETDNADRFTHDVKFVCRKLGAKLLPKGRARSVYDQKGVITVNATKDNSPLDCAKATDIAIEAGAEDVQEIENDNAGKALQFLCDPDDLYTVKKHIESTNYIVDEARIKYLARDDAMVDLSDEQMGVAEKLYNQLEELPEVTYIYDNIS